MKFKRRLKTRDYPKTIKLHHLNPGQERMGAFTNWCEWSAKFPSLHRLVGCFEEHFVCPVLHRLLSIFLPELKSHN